MGRVQGELRDVGGMVVTGKFRSIRWEDKIFRRKKIIPAVVAGFCYCFARKRGPAVGGDKEREGERKISEGVCVLLINKNEKDGICGVYIL